MSSLLNDRQIIQEVHNHSMIEPFESKLINTDFEQKIISYGLSSAGYDMRLDPHFKVLVPYNGEQILDPKRVTESHYESVFADSIIVSPGNTILGTSMEYFRIPEDISCVVLGKSTYARCGIHVLTTPAEPGWHGKLTIEISNLSPIPVKVYAREGICQMLFFKLDGRPITTYLDRNGKYNGQTTTTIAKV